MNYKVKNLKLAIIGLGYVGLPLALEFSKKRNVIGFDINRKRVNDLILGKDKNLEISKKDIKSKKLLSFTSNQKDLNSANCFIITAPTPVDKYKKPDLRPLLNACKIVGKVLKKNNLVIIESTVFPGCVEEKCVPILEKYSGLKFNHNFYCGYSPERINPGDKKFKISNIKKITSGSTSKISILVDNLYKEIIKAGTFKAESIKVAEAAKVIENTQRDINIGLINELSIIFRKLNINTESVLNAAKSKWNFIPFKPGLVGGHCIGVDPYYLTHKAQSVGYKPRIILAGRSINDKMGNYVSRELVKKMKSKQIKIKGSKILIMGLTFKENCTDIRNSGVENIFKYLKRYRCKVELFDPWANLIDVKMTYSKVPNVKLEKNTYDGIVVAVAHNEFKKMGIKKIKNLCKKKHVIFDLKFLFSSNKVDLRL